MMEESKIYKIWLVSTIGLTMIILAMLASVTIYIDPLFHYHAPLDRFAYPIDRINTGTSMTENFKKTEADVLFDADFIKVPYMGGTYKEINDNLKRAYHAGKNIRYVIRCLDYSLMDTDKDAYSENMDYPFYLYNDNLFDDLNYVLNKEILFTQTGYVIDYTRDGNQTTSFDEYAN